MKPKFFILLFVFFGSYANDYVLLQEGFEVSNGATVLINTMSCQSDQSMSKAAVPPNPLKPHSIQLKTDIKNRHHNE